MKCQHCNKTINGTVHRLDIKGDQLLYYTREDYFCADCYNELHRICKRSFCSFEILYDEEGGGYKDFCSSCTANMRPFDDIVFENKLDKNRKEITKLYKEFGIII